MTGNPTRRHHQPLPRRIRRIAWDLRTQGLLLALTLLPAAWVPGTARAGVIEPPNTRPTGAARSEPRPPAYVIHLPGIAGPMRIDQRLARGIADGGGDGLVETVEIFDWVGSRRGFAALFGHDENLRQARRLAAHIVELKQQQPDRPIVITSHSGGTAVAAWALEMLPEVATEAQAGEVKVDGMIMLASGLSSSYDLSAALTVVTGRVFHVSSPYDNLILGAGTLLFGTLDRERDPAAGRLGFRLPAGVDPETYFNFFEVPYDPAWESLGHFGGHEGMMSVAFGREVVTPLIRAALGEEVDLPTTRAVAEPTTRPVTVE